jgi:hypothetical protein
MIELAPGWVVEVEDSTRNHWVGHCGGIGLVFAYEGSYNDVRHVEAMATCIERLGKQAQTGVRILFVVPPLHAKPPDQQVRHAMVQGMRKCERHIARCALVIGGTGFGSAIHRGVATGLLTIARPKFQLKIEADVGAGLSFLLDRNSPAFLPLLRYCQERAIGPLAK